MKHRSAKHYDGQFKADVLAALSHSNKPLTQVARDFGVAESTLWKWRYQYLQSLRPEASPPPGVQVPSAELPPSEAQMAFENRQLRRQLDDLRTQHEILKKALGILSQQDPLKSMPSSEV